MDLKDATHPIWKILRIAVVMGGMALILDRTASSFDFGEVKAAAGGGLLVALFDLGKYMYTKG